MVDDYDYMQPRLKALTAVQALLACCSVSGVHRHALRKAERFVIQPPVDWEVVDPLLVLEHNLLIPTLQMPLHIPCTL